MMGRGNFLEKNLLKAIFILGFTLLLTCTTTTTTTLQKKNNPIDRRRARHSRLMCNGDKKIKMQMFELLHSTHSTQYANNESNTQRLIYFCTLGTNKMSSS